MATIVIAGSLAQKPFHGGHTWVFLQYLLGFKRLGYDVLFLDRFDSASGVDTQGKPCPGPEAFNLHFIRNVFDRFDLADSYSVNCDGGAYYFGLSRNQVMGRVKDSSLFINVMGFCNDAELLAAAPRKAFLDIDPGFGQMWRELGLHDPFEGHDDFITIGENIGQAGCTIPDCGLNWITTPQPIVLEHWPVSRDRKSRNEAFTSIASWRGAYGTIQFKGANFGLRVHEFRKFASLPKLTGKIFRLALDIHPAEKSDLALLDDNGWLRDDPRVVASDPWKYRNYIQDSLAECMIAKNIYVQTNSGWFSDRSICYLASGKPVLAQDTGLRDRYPGDVGVVLFSTLKEARAGVESICADYELHARAARRLAEEHFDSDKVLRKLLSTLSIN